ncbi:glutamine synthetase [Pararhizobium capsulatum DSM 1112]|uniref:Glutamine synthetase n=1 Tax=Pararhizobium capsulatum DSM 1112 TaxID=1121113 RepID=A0ABU0BYE2_9HYPH|nr:glutamine synthetase family protein [Pararhizobium capsulatum]MDQ0322952.1 glutamine synthetase [Pararhizobium capsulatum DSM 1112]
MSSRHERLTGIVTTDIAAVTRGRFIASDRLEKTAATGVGWLQANLSLTPFNIIADPNPWGSSGDLRLLPDLGARFRTENTGATTPFDLVPGNLFELDGSPWSCCTRTMLIDALSDLRAETGLSLLSAFEHEFQIFGTDFPAEHVLSFAGLRRADAFTSQLMAALEEAGVSPEVIISEFGIDQFEVTHAPADGLAAADRAVAIREITREIARSFGWKASFAPKTAPTSVGNGVHIHFSLIDAGGNPATYDEAGPSGLSSVAGSFCAGILRRLPAITVLTASSLSSYYRLKPHHWSSSYTWLGDKEREATLRICPVVTMGGRNPARTFNIEYRAADATANPYLALAALVRAGLEGLREGLACPPIVTGDPGVMEEDERRQKGLIRLPETLPAALAAFKANEAVPRWFSPIFVETFAGMKEAEMKALAGLDEAAICERYRAAY